MSNTQIRTFPKSHMWCAQRYKHWQQQSLCKKLVFIVLLCGTSAACVLATWIWLNIRDLPDLRTLTNYKPWQITRLFDRHGNAFAEFSEQRRTLIPYDQVPKHLIHAILAAEDAAFFNHRGLDYSGILRAFWKNLWKKRGAPKQGGSTITQQVVKTFLFSPKQHYRRKLREALLARQLEQNLSKKEILYLYLNQIYFGRGCYGIEEAARYYFNKTTKQLSIAESAVLAGIPKNPPRYNPAAYPKDAQKRRNYVLRMMYRQGWLSFDTYEALRKTILKKRAYPRHYPFQRSYYTEEIKRRTLRKIQDTLPKTWSLQRRQRYAQQIFYRNGLRIETALDPELQKRAQQSVRQTLEQKFASPTIPSQHTPTTASHLPQAALVAIDIRTHLVRALVGGRNVTDSPFNRTTQAVRPPGSAFKPILYAAALASRRYTLASTLLDAYFVALQDGQRWVPHNASKTYSNRSIRLREALTRSLNTVAVRLIDALGPQRVVQMAQKLGIQSTLKADLPLALGTSSVSPLELTNAYATFAAEGIFDRPYLLNTVTHNPSSRKTISIFQRMPDPQRILSTQIAYLITDTLRDVVRRGTAKAARTLPIPLAGKTGTTNRNRDAWFVGYTPQICVGIWVGHDDQRSLGPKGTGAQAALPIAIHFLKALQHLQPLSRQDFQKPEGLRTLSIDPQSGLRAAPGYPSILESFLPGTEPKQLAPHHTNAIRPRDFYTQE